VLHALCGRCQSTSPKQRGLECADIAARCRGGLLDFRNGDRLDLDQKIRMREAAHLDGVLVGSAPKYSIRTPTCYPRCARIAGLFVQPKVRQFGLRTSIERLRGSKRIEEDGSAGVTRRSSACAARNQEAENLHGDDLHDRHRWKAVLFLGFGSGHHVYRTVPVPA
jgi:hypothetical protein